MKYKFNQTRSKISAEYRCVNEEGILCTASIPVNFSGKNATVFYNNIEKYYINFDRIEAFKSKFKDRLSSKIIPYNVFNATNELVGSICVKKIGYFNGYFFYEFTFNKVIYTIYEVGLGKSGIKVPIYKEEEQVALIEKDPVVYDNKDTYEITARDGDSLEIALIFNLYYDFIRFGNYGQIDYKSKKSYYLYSTNKELKSKYNSEFKVENS